METTWRQVLVVVDINSPRQRILLFRAPWSSADGPIHLCDALLELKILALFPVFLFSSFLPFSSHSLQFMTLEAFQEKCWPWFSGVTVKLVLQGCSSCNKQCQAMIGCRYHSLENYQHTSAKALKQNFAHENSSWRVFFWRLRKAFPGLTLWNDFCTVCPEVSEETVTQDLSSKRLDLSHVPVGQSLRGQTILRTSREEHGSGMWDT